MCSTAQLSPVPLRSAAAAAAPATPSIYLGSLCGETNSSCRCVRVNPDDTGLNTRDRDGKFRRGRRRRPFAFLCFFAVHPVVVAAATALLSTVHLLQPRRRTLRVPPLPRG